MAKGIPMKVGKVDLRGGYVETGGSAILRMAGLGGGADASTVMVLPAGTRIKTGGPYSVKVSGVQGDDEADINGDRTFTRVDGVTFTTGINASIFGPNFFDKSEVTGVPLELIDQDVPNRTTYDWDE